MTAPPLQADSVLRTILVVDDDARVLQTFSRNLRLYGYHVVTAPDGEAALDVHAREEPDLALVDVRMPGLDGFGVLEALLARDVAAEVVLVTGHGDMDTTIAALRAGATDFIPKPVDPAALEAALRRAHERLRLKHELSAAEAALKEERKMLAQRVAERTAALSTANAELARAARLKDEFLASMSHELRTPLNAVLGMSEVLLRELYGPLNERQHKYVQTIERSGRHLLSLINDILDLSKIEAGKTELRAAPFDVAQVCRESVQLVQPQVNKKRLMIQLQLGDDAVMLDGDKRRVKQILVNLLSNAVKFTPEGGQIGLELAADAARHMVQLVVWDTGIGIAPGLMHKLFQPFVQLDSSLARAHEGTGLGLALVYRLTELHGGSVAVESEVGEGSRFTVSLPWTPPEDSAEAGEVFAEAGAAQAAGDVGRVRASVLVLLAEDNPANIETLTAYLDALGHRVVVARDGEEALARAREARPDVILMDIQLPGMDGLTATRRLRADDELADIPIIAVTALAMPGDRARCLEAGVDVYLSKPVSFETLRGALEGLLK